MIKKLFSNKYLKSGGLYLFGNLFNKAISFLTVPIFTRILSTEEYGIVSTYSSWVSIMAVIVGLALGNTIRNAYVDFKEDLDGYISSVFTLSFLNFLIILCLAIGVNLNVSFVSMPLLVMCLVESFGTFIVNSIIIKYMMEEESFKRTILLVTPNLCAAIISVILILNMDSNKLYGRLIPMCFIPALFGGVIFVENLFKGKKLFNKKYWKYALSISVPLVFHGLSSNILSTSDRTLITMFKSASETGIYSVACSIAVVSTVITTSIESVWIPYFTRKMIANQKQEVNRNAKLYIELCTIMFCGIIIVGPEVLVIFASEKYRSGINVIAPVVLATYFQYLYSLAVNTEYYYKKTQIIATNTVVAAVVNLVLNLIFIPLWGALAAAFTTTVSYAISFLLHYRYCKKLDEELFPVRTFLMPLIIISCFTVFQYITLEQALLRWIIGIALIVVYGVTILLKEWGSLKSFLR